MIKFTYQFDYDGVWIHKDESSTHYDNPKNAAEACYLLLTGVNLLLDDNKECTFKQPTGDQNDLAKIAINYNYVKDQYPLFQSVFYEEINLAILIQGGINE